jgi:hypothetical protein
MQMCQKGTGSLTEDVKKINPGTETGIIKEKKC